MGGAGGGGSWVVGGGRGGVGGGVGSHVRVCSAGICRRCYRMRLGGTWGDPHLPLALAAPPPHIPASKRHPLSLTPDPRPPEPRTYLDSLPPPHPCAPARATHHSSMNLSWRWGGTSNFMPKYTGSSSMSLPRRDSRSWIHCRGPGVGWWGRGPGRGAGGGEVSGSREGSNGGGRDRSGGALRNSCATA
mgnify:CR=1 FL=1